MKPVKRQPQIAYLLIHILSIKEMDKCCKAHKGLWNAEAEKMILKHFNVEI